MSAETSVSEGHPPQEHVRWLIRHATTLNNDERFDEALPYFQSAYSHAIQEFGPSECLTHEALNCLALCNLNRMDYAAALEYYRSLMTLLRLDLPLDDPLVALTEANVLRCERLAKAPTPRSVAEIVFRSCFCTEEEHAQFVAEHGVRVERGTRLDPDGSALFVLSPVPERPAFVEHMPVGVEVPHYPGAWTLQIRWDHADGQSLTEQRYSDGTIRRRWT